MACAAPSDLVQVGLGRQTGRLHQFIGECLAKGAGNLFFSGSGGAAILMQPAAQLLQPTALEEQAKRG